MDPTPGPETDLGAVSTIGFEVVAALFLILLILGVFIFALLRAGRYPPSVGLVIALSLLSATAMLSFAITGQEVLGTIAATGIGALAGAVSAVWAERKTVDGEHWKSTVNEQTVDINPPEEEKP